MHRQIFARRPLLWLLLAMLLLPVSLGYALAQESMGLVEIVENTFPPMDLDGDGENDQVSLLFQGVQGSQDAILQCVMGNGNHYAFILGSGQDWQITAIDAADLTGNGTRNIILMTSYAGDTNGRYEEPVILRTTSAGIYAMTLPVLENGQAGYAFDVSFGIRYTLNIEGLGSNFLLCAPLDNARHRALYTADGYIDDTVCDVSPFHRFEVIPYGEEEYALALYQSVTCGALTQPVGEIVSTLIWRMGINNLEYQLIAQEFVEAE